MHADRFRTDIEGLRAIAVLAVLGYHFFPSYVPGGYLGVDAFFVISGYLITGVIVRGSEAGRFTIRDFYARRIRRLFPAMLTVLAACLLAAAVLLFSFELARFARHITAALLYVENFNLARELGYFDSDARGKPLLHFWSLAVEEQFYLVWPLLIIFVARGRRLAVLVLSAVIAVGSFIYTVGPAHGGEATFFDPLARAWELALGALLATGPDLARRTGRLAVNAMSLIAFLALIGAMFWTIPEGWHPGAATLWPVLATAVLIACGPPALANRRLLSTPPAVAVGGISYVLYLWHWPLLAFPFYVIGDKPAPAVRLALLALSFVLAAATSRWIERPVRSRKDVGRMAVILLGLAAALLAATWGAVAWRNAAPDVLQARIERQLEGPMWAFVANDACRNRYTVPADHPFCALSRDEDPTLILAGNSFANHLYYGFGRDARTRSHAILSYGSCNHLDSTRTGACRMQTAVARDARGVQAVVVSELWPEFTSDGRMLEPVDHRPPRPGAPNATAFADELRSWIRSIAKPGTPVIIIGPKPELPYDAKFCFDRPFKSAPHDCRVRTAVARRETAGTRAVLREVANSIPGARYVDVLDVFCRADYCSYVDREGLPLLRDNGHLSRKGSELVVAHILAQLDAEAGANPLVRHPAQLR